MELLLKIFLSLIFTTMLSLAKSLYLSQLPLPTTYIMDTSVKECDTKCLQTYLQNGEIFFFLSGYEKSISNANLSKAYKTLKIKLNIFNAKKANRVKIALMIPKNIIGRYSISTTNAILAYLLQKRVDFDFELFDSKDETLQNIQNTINDIESKGFKFVIAPYTDTGVKRLLTLKSNLIFYIPTINKNEIPTKKMNFIFGGINYKKQIEKLLAFTNDKIAIFVDKSSMGFKLSNYIQSDDKRVIYKKVIPQKLTKFRSFLRHNRKLNNSSIFLNTPLVKTNRKH